MFLGAIGLIYNIYMGLSLCRLCALSAYTFGLIGRSCDATGANDFRELWSLTIGSGSAWIVDIMIMGIAGGVILVKLNLTIASSFWL